MQIHCVSCWWLLASSGSCGGPTAWGAHSPALRRPRAPRARSRAALRRREKLATVNFFFINFNN